MAAHTHRFSTISHVIAPGDPHVLRACQVGTCAETESVCVLCEARGDRRVHKKHLGVSDEAMLEEIERLTIASYAGNLGLAAELRNERTASKTRTSPAGPR